jgi:hypothetical protein
MERYYKMTNVKQSAVIASMVKTTNPKASSKVISIVGDSVLLNSTATFAEGIQARDNSVSLMNKALEPLHKAKAKFVKLSEKSKKDTSEYQFTQKAKTMLTDTLKALVSPATGKPYSAGSIEQYWKTYFNAVNSGKPIAYADSNKNKQGKKAGEAKEQAIDSMLAKINAHSEFANLPESLQDEIRDYLESEGFEGIN